MTCCRRCGWVYFVYDMKSGLVGMKLDLEGPRLHTLLSDTVSAVKRLIRYLSRDAIIVLAPVLFLTGGVSRWGFFSFFLLSFLLETLDVPAVVHEPTGFSKGMSKE